MRKLVAVLALAVLGASLLAAVPASARPDRVELIAGTGTRSPRFVTGIDEVPRRGDAVSVALAHLAEHEGRYGIAAPGRDLERIQTHRRGDVTTVRFRQLHRGVPVFGAQYLVHQRVGAGASTVEAVNGHYFTGLTVPTAPRIDETAAARLALLSARPMKPTDVEPRGLTVIPRGDGVLAYHFTVSGSRLGGVAKKEVFVNARAGGVALTFGSLAGATAVTGTGTTAHGDTVDLNVTKVDETLYEMRDRSRSMFASNGGEIRTHDLNGSSVYVAHEGNIVESGSSHFAGDDTDSGAVDAHYNAGLVYEFFRALGRNSIDGRGGTIVSLVDARENDMPMFNAFWDGTQMVYGNPNPQELHPFSADLDVVGHELTHGVTQHSGDLVYLGQSGAMNEAYSDYFGNAIDVDHAGMAMSDPRAGYIGEDLCKVPNPDQWQCPLRNLDGGETTSDYVFYLSDFDNGGVHLNSTIYAGALWQLRKVLGSRADGYVYDALVDYTTPLDNFFEGRLGVVAAAQAACSCETNDDIVTINEVFDEAGIVDGWDVGAPSDATTLMQNVAPLGYLVSPPQASGGRFVVGDFADKETMWSDPLQIYVGRVDGSDTPTPVGEHSSPRTYSDEFPDISGKRVVWSHIGYAGAGLEFDIHSRVLGNEVKTVTDARGTQWFPSIHRGLIAWEDQRSGSSDIWARYLGRKQIRVSSGRGEEWNPQVFGDWVAWWDMGVWDPSIGDFRRRPRIGLENVATGRSLSIKPPSTETLIGPPALGPNGVYWYQDSDYYSASPDHSGSILFARYGGARSVLVPEGDAALSPMWGGVTDVPPVPAVSGDHVVYSDERGYVLRAKGSDVPADQVGRDLWVVPASGGVPRRLTENRGDQAYPALARDHVVWLDSAQGQTDLVAKLVP